MTWRNNSGLAVNGDHTVQVLIKNIYPLCGTEVTLAFASVRTVVVQLGMLLEDFPKAITLTICIALCFSKAVAAFSSAGSSVKRIRAPESHVATKVFTESASTF